MEGDDLPTRLPPRQFLESNPRSPFGSPARGGGDEIRGDREPSSPTRDANFHPPAKRPRLEAELRDIGASVQALLRQRDREDILKQFDEAILRRITKNPAYNFYREVIASTGIPAQLDPLTTMDTTQVYLAREKLVAILSELERSRDLLRRSASVASAVPERDTSDEYAKLDAQLKTAQNNQIGLRERYNTLKTMLAPPAHTGILHPSEILQWWTRVLEDVMGDAKLNLMNEILMQTFNTFMGDLDRKAVAADQFVRSPKTQTFIGMLSRTLTEAKLSWPSEWTEETKIMFGTLSITFTWCMPNVTMWSSSEELKGAPFPAIFDYALFKYLLLKPLEQASKVGFFELRNELFSKVLSHSKMMHHLITEFANDGEKATWEDLFEVNDDIQIKLESEEPTDWSFSSSSPVLHSTGRLMKTGATKNYRQAVLATQRVRELFPWLSALGFSEDDNYETQVDGLMFWQCFQEGICAILKKNSFGVCELLMEIIKEKKIDRFHVVREMLIGVHTIFHSAYDDSDPSSIMDARRATYQKYNFSRLLHALLSALLNWSTPKVALLHWPDDTLRNLLKEAGLEAVEFELRLARHQREQLAITEDTPMPPPIMFDYSDATTFQVFSSFFKKGGLFGGNSLGTLIETGALNAGTAHIEQNEHIRLILKMYGLEEGGALWIGVAALGAPIYVKAELKKVEANFHLFQRRIDELTKNMETLLNEAERAETEPTVSTTTSEIGAIISALENERDQILKRARAGQLVAPSPNIENAANLAFNFIRSYSHGQDWCRNVGDSPRALMHSRNDMVRNTFASLTRTFMTSAEQTSGVRRIYQQTRMYDLNLIERRKLGQALLNIPPGEIMCPTGCDFDFVVSSKRTPY